MDPKSSVKQYPVTIFLAAANVLVFLLLFLGGDPGNASYMLSRGALYYPLVFSGEWWRLFSAMFLHFSAEHLISNMISLIAMGSIVEHAFGHARYAIVYLVSGLCAGIVSCLWFSHAGQAVVSAGASGAIFGLTGTILSLALFNKTGQYGIDRRRVPLAVILSVAVGIESGTDTAAHIGGLLAGFLISFLFSRKARP